MRNIIEDFGTNAGKVLKELEFSGPLNMDKIIKRTRLSNEEFSTAIGWLARENKILKKGSLYKIGQTNLTEKIGGDAGKVWNVLNTWGEIDLSYINKLAKIKKMDMYYALGWLAKEGKIKAKYVKPKEMQIRYRLADGF